MREAYQIENANIVDLGEFVSLCQNFATQEHIDLDGAEFSRDGNIFSVAFREDIALDAAAESALRTMLMDSALQVKKAAAA